MQNISFLETCRLKRNFMLLSVVDLKKVRGNNRHHFPTAGITCSLDAIPIFLKYVKPLSTSGPHLLYSRQVCYNHFKCWRDLSSQIIFKLGSSPEIGNIGPLLQKFTFLPYKSGKHHHNFLQNFRIQIFLSLPCQMQKWTISAYSCPTKVQNNLNNYSYYQISRIWILLPTHDLVWRTCHFFWYICQ